MIGENAMTRERHIGIEIDRLLACPGWDRQSPEIIRNVAVTNVDCFVRHGILKLDEPRRSAEDRLCSELCIQGFNPTARVSVYSAIDRAGLRIVEK
jgi:hypothetical protein